MYEQTKLRRSELLMVMAVQRQTARVTALIRTLFLAAVSALALSLVLIGLDTWPLFQVSNDFEYTWGRHRQHAHRAA